GRGISPGLVTLPGRGHAWVIPRSWCAPAAVPLLRLFLPECGRSTPYLPAAPIGDLQVIVPVHVVFTELPAAVDGLAAIGEGTGEPLREPGRVPPEPPPLIIYADFVHAEDTPRIEVMHTQAGLGFGLRIEVRRVFHAIAPSDPNDGDRVG